MQGLVLLDNQKFSEQKEFSQYFPYCPPKNMVTFAQKHNDLSATAKLSLCAETAFLLK